MSSPRWHQRGQRSDGCIEVPRLVYPNLRDPVLRLQLGKGLGHNTYGEPAWPNDLLYMFPICILAIVFLGFGQAVGMPIEVGEPADPFATPLEILPEWFLLPAFEILRAVPNKLLGIGAMIAIPVGLATVPILEAANPFANPIRHLAIHRWLVSFPSSWLLICPSTVGPIALASSGPTE